MVHYSSPVIFKGMLVFFKHVFNIIIALNFDIVKFDALCVHFKQLNLKS